MIEVDLQLTMGTFLGLRIAENHKNNKWISKHNHGCRKGHSTELALLEKRLIFDLVKKDLEACCGRQLPNIGGMVEESIGANREAIKLITKEFPRWKHFVGTTHDMSKESHGGMNALVGRTGQGNVFLGNACRDVSCFVLKQIEKKLLGTKVTSRHNNIEVQIKAIAFVDDSDFYSSRTKG